MSKTLTSDVSTAIATHCQPIVLIEVQLSTYVYYALFPIDISFNGNTYTGIGGQLGNIQESSDMTINQVDVTFENISQIFSTYLFAANPTEFRGKTIVITRILAEHIGDSNDYEPLWEGIITTWNLDGRNVTFTIKHWIYTLQDEIPRRTCHRVCSYLFGGTYCGLTGQSGGGTGKYDSRTGLVADAGGTTTRLVDSVLSQANDYWNYGFVTFTTGNNAGFPARKISDSNQAGTYVDFETAWPYTITAGDTYNIVQGCDHTDNTCSNMFYNMLNYGGNLSVPRKSYR